MFDKLLEELDDLTKAMPTEDSEDDEKIVDAAAEGAEDGDKDEDDEDGEGPMTKAIDVTMPDGSIAKAIDATEILADLSRRIETREAGDATLAKAMGGIMSLIGQQSALIKSLQGQVAKLGGEGRGRKAVVSVVDKGSADLTKAMGGGAPEETGTGLLIKAMAAQREGRLTGSDVAIVEASVNRGIAPPDQIMSRITAPNA